MAATQTRSRKKSSSRNGSAKKNGNGSAPKKKQQPQREAQRTQAPSATAGNTGLDAMLTDATMSGLSRWLPDPNDRHKVLWENPARLFGFEQK